MLSHLLSKATIATLVITINIPANNINELELLTLKDNSNKTIVLSQIEDLNSCNLIEKNNKILDFKYNYCSLDY